MPATENMEEVMKRPLHPKLIKDVKRFEDAYIKLAEIDDGDAINSEFSVEPKAPTYTKQRLSELLGVSDERVGKAISSLEKADEYVARDGGNRCQLTLDQAHKIITQFGIKSVAERRAETPDAHVLPVVSVTVAKGGVGKTHAALHLAVEAALDPKRGRRVLLADFDVQGSIRHYLTSAGSSVDSIKSIHKLVKDNLNLSREERLKPENQELYRKYLLEEVIIESYIDNLSFIPSVLTDSHIPVLIAQALGNSSPELANTIIKDVVIEPLKNDFDLVVVDTGPSPDVFLTSILYASNHLVIPTTPRRQDYRAYLQYLCLLGMTYGSLMPSDCEGVFTATSLITKHQNRDDFNAVANRVSTSGSCFSARFLENKKFEDASKDRVPLQFYDTSNTRGVRDALTSVRSVYSELDSLISLHEFK
ncbi:ParA family protein [Vibrio chagasii]|nr:ParA family protein [Vibrio chagasii]